MNETSSVANKAYVPKKTLGKENFGMCEEVKEKYTTFVAKCKPERHLFYGGKELCVP